MKFAAVFLAALLPLQAFAACVGQNLIDALPPAARAELDAAVAAHAYPEGNLWRAEKDGRVVHVAGTVHLPDPRLDRIVARLAPAFETAEVLVLETTSDGQAEMQRLMAENPEIGFLTEGPTLIDLLDPPTWAHIAEELEARGVPAFVGAKFRPWLLSVTLAMPLCAAEQLQSGETGLDFWLEAMATERGLPIETLDDLRAMLEIFNTGTLEEQIEMLEATALLDTDAESMMRTALDSYFAGRHREIWEFSRLTALGSGTDPETMAEVEEAFLDGRNEDWAPKIAAIVAERDAIIAVGAAHLSGETGVLRTLERLGFTLTPM